MNVCGHCSNANDRVIVSGADDGFLKLWDIRLSNTSPITTNKTHTAGVTSFLNNRFADYQLFTGSYDEHLRLFDMRSIKTNGDPVTELNLGGGVWHMGYGTGCCSQIILASCMYNGWCAIKQNGTVVEVKSSHSEQGENLLYGASLVNHSRFATLAAFCTFNDNFVFLQTV